MFADINLKALMERINYFSDFIENKNITLSQKYEEDITIVMKNYHCRNIN